MFDFMKSNLNDTLLNTIESEKVKTRRRKWDAKQIKQMNLIEGWQKAKPSLKTNFYDMTITNCC